MHKTVAQLHGLLEKLNGSSPFDRLASHSLIAMCAHAWLQKDIST